MSDLKHTQRGFAYIEFQDRYDHKCSIQKSSLATEDAIWFGIDDANPQVLHVDARRLGIETDATSGWVPYPLPAEVSLATRMHLTQDQVRELLPTLIHFAETGDVLAPADCRAQPEATAPGDPAPIYKYHDDGKVTLANSDKIPSYRTAPAPEPEFICEITEGTVRINPYGDEPIISGKRTYTVNIPAAQDLSAAILAIDIPSKCLTHQASVYGFEQGLKAAAALASSANTLSAGDRVDAERWRFRQKFLLDGGAVLWSQRGCQYRNAHGVIMCQGATEEEAIDAAILQSQKRGSDA